MRSIRLCYIVLITANAHATKQATLCFVTHVYAQTWHSAQSLLLFQTCSQSVTLATVYMRMMKKFAVLYSYVSACAAVKKNTRICLFSTEPDMPAGQTLSSNIDV